MHNKKVAVTVKYFDGVICEWINTFLNISWELDFQHRLYSLPHTLCFKMHSKRILQIGIQRISISASIYKFILRRQLFGNGMGNGHAPDFTFLRVKRNIIKLYDQLFNSLTQTDPNGELQIQKSIYLSILPTFCWTLAYVFIYDWIFDWHS